jgi:hypothetical protein
MGAHPVAVGPGDPGHRGHQPLERILDVSAEQVDVGDLDLCLDVVRARGRGLARSVEIDLARARDQLGTRESGTRLVVGGVVLQHLLIGRDRAVEVAGRQRLLGSGVLRVDRRLCCLLVTRGSRTGSWLDPAGHAVGDRRLHHLLEDLPKLVDRNSLLCQGRELPAQCDRDQRSAGDADGLHDLGVGVDVDLREQEPAGELVGQRLQRGVQLDRDRLLARPETDDHRHLHAALHLGLEVRLVQVDAVRTAACGWARARTGSGAGTLCR